MKKASQILEDALLEINSLERISMDYNDFVYARGIDRCKLVVEKALVKILTLENDGHA
jgi:hypothetical protein